MALADEIAAWIGNVVRDAGAQGVVVGLSGGIDSAVTAVLAHRALQRGVLGAILPCESDPRDAEDALLLASEFGIETTTLDLTEPCHALAAILPDAPAIARANVKPRLRMIALYYLAASRKYLVCGASNRSELAIGYFTKYGDGGVDMMPLGALLKSQVRQLAAELRIPHRIINKAPTAGLWPGQTDEGEMALLYSELDAALVAMDRGDAASIAPHVLARVHELMQRSAHKRALPPIFQPAD